MVLSLAHASCSHYETETSITEDSWNPFAGISPPRTDVIAGRLWAMPNPVRFGVDETGEPAEEIVLWLVNFGSESVRVLDATFTGDPDFSFPHQIDPSLENPFPVDIPEEADCDLTSSYGISFKYSPVSGDQASGTITVHTEDPTSPSFEIPVEVDLSGEFVVEYPWQHQDDTHLSVKPNPIYFSRDSAEEIRVAHVCVSYQGDVDALIFGLDVHGNDFSIQSATPGFHEIVIEYQSPSEPVEHGALVFELVDNWNRNWTLAVPILVL